MSPDKAANILVIDDDPVLGHLLRRLAEKEGHRSTVVATLSSGLEALTRERYDLVFLDINLPDGNGLDALPVIKQLEDSPEVLIITGHTSPNGALLALEQGAWDYIDKGSPREQIVLKMSRALRFREQRTGRVRVLSRKGIVSDSPSMQKVLEMLALAADSRASVLITGETGTGKELIARAVHENSPRRGGSFVVVDCAALPEQIMESVLFGHVKGAFTGASAASDGLVRSAHGGTLFLDEIGELPLAMQKAFLRVLQERTVRPVGAKQELLVDFRLIAATNRNLESMVAQGAFREDLLYRLRSFVLELPPLRARKEDFKALIQYHVTQFCEQYGLASKGISGEVLEVLQAHSWPGNVRELVQALERSVLTAGNDPMLFPEHLPMELRLAVMRQGLSEPASTSIVRGASRAPMPEDDGTLPQFKVFRDGAVDRAEREYILKLLGATGGSIKEACGMAGLSRTRLYMLMQKHALQREAFK